MLNVGDMAPEFSLPDSDMNMTALSSFEGKNIVLYFYPKDDTPGCTIQATDFTERCDAFKEANAVVLGVSRDDCISHSAFRDKFGLMITLLADVDSVVSEAYHVLEDVEGSDKQKSVRSSFVIDPEGVIRYAEYGVGPKGHADKLLEVIRAL